MMWTTQQRSSVGGLAAITRGTGANVLLLHGVGLRAEAWGAQFELPGRIVAPDMPGHGHSAGRDGGLLLEDFVLAALSVLEKMDGPTVVVGHSMGAMLAVELAGRAADMVSGVAALNAVFERSPAAKEAVERRAAELDGKTIPDQTTTLDRWFGRAASEERFACDQWLNAVNPAAYKSAYTAFATSSAPDRERLAWLQCPALFMTGAEEPNSTPEMSKAMADLAPNGRAIIVEGAAHMMPMTHPDPVNAALSALIEEVST